MLVVLLRYLIESHRHLVVIVVVVVVVIVVAVVVACDPHRWFVDRLLSYAQAEGIRLLITVTVTCIIFQPFFHFRQ